MRRPLFTVLAVLPVALVVQAASPVRALAQTPTRVVVAEAKGHFDKGLKLYKERALPEALAEFAAAYRLVPRASVLRNIAQCHRDMKQFAAAYDAYAEMLDKYGASLKPAEQKQVKAAIADLSVVTGTVRVTSNEAGAIVELDARDVGATPLPAPVRVNVGAHEISVKKPGFAAYVKRVELVGKDEVTVAAELARDNGHLLVTAVGGDATSRLVIDGRDVGPLPWEGELPAGAHRVEVVGKEARSPVRTVTLARGGRVELAVEVTRELGHVLVDPHLPDASIKIDGEPIGRGAWEGDLKAGRHELEIVAPGYSTFRRVLLVHQGERRVESVVLLPASAAAPDYRGIYAGLDAAFLVSPNPSNFAQSTCEKIGKCSSSGVALGPGGLASIGWSFGNLGLEAVGYFRYDVAKAAGTGALSVKGVPQTKAAIDTSFDAVVFGGGVGARFLTKHPLARFSAGFRVLLVDELFAEKGTTDTIFKGRKISTASSAAPLFALDAGVLLGSTPGAKVRLGVLASLEVFPSPVNEADKATVVVSSYYVERGAQLFVGPTLGVQFGN